MSVNEIDEPGDDDHEDEEDTGNDSDDGNDEEASFEEFLSKAKGKSDSDEEEDTVLELTREERLESLSIRAAPKQPNEFVCSSCRLVKHESQMADRARELCRDCV